MTKADSKLRRWQLRRLLVVVVGVVAVAWAMLESVRYRAEHRAISVMVIVDGPPAGFPVRFPGVSTNGWVHHVPYDELPQPPVSRADIAAIKFCLARQKFLPLFPAEIQVDKGDVTARYGMKINRRTGRVREQVVMFVQEKNSWRIERICQTGGVADFVRPPTLWDKFLSYLPFTD